MRTTNSSRKSNAERSTANSTRRERVNLLFLLLLEGIAVITPRHELGDSAGSGDEVEKDGISEEEKGKRKEEGLELKR